MAKLLFQGHASCRITTHSGTVIYIDPFAGEGYADGGEIALLSGQTARVFTLQRADVDYAAYLVEGEGAAFTLLTVCSTQAEDYALRLREVVDTFTLTPQSEAA